MGSRQLENANLKEEGAWTPTPHHHPWSPPMPAPPRRPLQSWLARTGSHVRRLMGSSWPRGSPSTARSHAWRRARARSGRGWGRARGPARPRGPGAAGRGGDAERRPGGSGRPVAGNAGRLVPRTAPPAGAAERGEEETPEAAGADECRNTAHCGEVGTLRHNVACVEERMAYSTHERARDVWGLPHGQLPRIHGSGLGCQARPQSALPHGGSPRPWAGAPDCLPQKVEPTFPVGSGAQLGHQPGQSPSSPGPTSAPHRPTGGAGRFPHPPLPAGSPAAGSPAGEAVATILLVCISAAWACGLPLLRSRRRALSTLGMLALLSLAGHCWEGTCW
ncbi:unnamed protein product [Caretta caretta]